MQKIFSFLLCLFLIGISAGVPLCPFDPDDNPEGAPMGTTIQAMTVGSVYGFSMITQENAWYTSGNKTGQQSNAFTALSGQGVLNVMADTKLSTKLYGLTSTTARAIEYQGQGMAFDDSSYFESSSRNESLSCESVIGGARAIFSSGAYGSQTLGTISPGNGMTISQEIGTGEAAPVRPTGMVGVFTVYGASSQNYGDMGQDFRTSATFGGTSTVVHQFKFDTMTE
jgi:hypothetical protein